MTRHLLALLLAAASVVLPRAAEADNGKPPPGAVVAGVEVVYPGEVTESLKGLIGIKPGDVYSPKKVRESIKLLFLKGVFEDVVVEGRDTPQGVVLVYHLVPKVRVSRIDVEGNEEIPTKKVLEFMALKEGEFIEVPLVRKSLEGIRKLYESEGFRKADAAITTSKIDELRAGVQVLIKEGPPATVKEIKVDGELALPEKDLRKKLKIGPGDVLRKDDLDASVNALTEYYVHEDYVKAEVAPPRITYLDDQAAVEFHVKSGPRLEVAFEGNKSLSDRTLKKVLTFWEDRDVSEESISENLSKLTEYYKDKGYYFAVLTSRTEESASPPIVSVRYIVYEGPRSRLEKIVFSGNKEVGPDELGDAMELKESSFFRSARITDEAVEKDLDRLKTFYESKGYLKAELKAEEIEFSKDGAEATLRIDVNEGPRTYITDITLEGNKDIPAEDIKGLIKESTGTPFNPQRLTEDQNGILNLYSQKGYIHAGVEVEKKFSEDGRGVSLVFSVSEGIPVSVGRIILRGNEYTKDKVVLRELLVKPGAVYDYEKILKSQQKVYKLGFFSQVRIQPVEPEVMKKVKDLLVTVKEREAGAVEFGAGYGEFDRYRGFAEVSYRNLFGLGHSISLRGEASTKELKTILTYKWPWFMDWPLDFRSSLVFLDAQKVNYKIRDLIASVGFEKRFEENITASVVYQYEKLKLSAVAPGAVLAPEDKKKSNLASITPSVIFDYRDDPFNPTKGSLHGFILKWATTYLGSTVDFLKFTAQTSWYFPLYERVVFGFSARGGIEGWFSKKLEVPISDRFFLGGASSLRGYRLDSVAPKAADGTPAGGDSMVLFNAEVRFPLPYGFGLVTFLDAGNVWLLNKNVSAASVPQNGLNGLRYGAGVGLRYNTPVGPLRLDYGFKLNRLPGESGSVLHFTLGHAF